MSLTWIVQQLRASSGPFLESKNSDMGQIKYKLKIPKSMFIRHHKGYVLKLGFTRQQTIANRWGVSYNVGSYKDFRKQVSSVIGLHGQTWKPIVNQGEAEI